VSWQIHNLLGIVTYFAAAVGFFLLSFHPGLTLGGRSFFRAGAIAWLGLFIIMLAPELSPVRGLLQRLAEAILWFGVLLLAWRVLAPRPLAAAVPGDPSPPQNGEYTCTLNPPNRCRSTSWLRASSRAAPSARPNRTASEILSDRPVDAGSPAYRQSGRASR